MPLIMRNTDYVTSKSRPVMGKSRTMWGVRFFFPEPACLSHVTGHNWWTIRCHLTEQHSGEAGFKYCPLPAVFFFLWWNLGNFQPESYDLDLYKRIFHGKKEWPKFARLPYFKDKFLVGSKNYWNILFLPPTLISSM